MRANTAVIRMISSSGSFTSGHSYMKALRKMLGPNPVFNSDLNQRTKRASSAELFWRHMLKCVFLAMLCGANCALAGDDAIFRFRGAEYIATGSHFARHLNWSSKLPFDKSYSELTASQQAYVRDQYTGLLPEEEAPFPVDGLRAIFRLVDKSADQLVGRSETGPLIAVAKVDESGAVLSVSVFKTPSTAATAAISYALMNVEFKPARRNGKAVPMDYLLSVELL